MTVWDVPGQEHAVTVLHTAVAHDEVAHAWAFLGPAGVGQEAATRWLAAALNCEAIDPPCGVCHVCVRCLKGAHPALWEFAPEGASHLVDAVREEWLHAASRSVAEGRVKVLRIREADRMNDSAANAFLKALEEPPPNTVWVLELTDPDEVPDTILSRCRVVRFLPLREEILAKLAAELGLVDEVDSGLAVRAAMGSPQSIRRFAEAGGLDGLRAHRAWPGLLREGGPGMAVVARAAVDDEVKRRLGPLRDEHAAELDLITEQHGGVLPAGLARQIKTRHARVEREAKVATIQAALDDLAGWFRDCLVTLDGGLPLIHADAADAVAGDARALGAPALLEAIDLVFATREALESNVGEKLALEALFLRISALSYR